VASKWFAGKTAHSDAKKDNNLDLTVPVPNHKEIKFGTLKSTIRPSQVSSAELEA